MVSFNSVTKNKEEMTYKVMYGTDEESADQITGLASPTHFGRPRWPEVFKQLAERHANSYPSVYHPFLSLA